MAYFQVWVSVEKVAETKSSLQHFVLNQSDFFEIGANKLGKKVALLVYKRVPKKQFVRGAENLDTASIVRINKYKPRKS